MCQMYKNVIRAVILGAMIWAFINSVQMGEDQWKADTIWDGGVKLERVIIGNIDIDHQGDEVLVLG